MVETYFIKVPTRGQDDMVDLTQGIQGVTGQCQVVSGIVVVAVVGSTAAVTTIEYEPGLKVDFPAALEKIAPRDAHYEHEATWHDDNGHSHVRASLIGPSVTVPLVRGELALGTWQQVVLVECDTRPRERTVVVQVMGEATAL